MAAGKDEAGNGTATTSLSTSQDDVLGITERAAYDREAADPLSDLERLVLDEDALDADSGVPSPVTAKAAEVRQPTDDTAESGPDAQTDTTEGAEEGTPESAADAADSDKQEALGDKQAKQSDSKEEYSARVQKRIDELTARAKSAEEALAETRAAIAELRAKPVEKPVLEEAAAAQPAAGASPYATRIAQLEQTAELADEHPEGVELPDGKGGQKFFTPEQLRTAQRNAQRELRTLTAQEAVWKAEQEHRFASEVERNMTRARSKFTFLNDTTTPEHQMAKKILTQAPELRRFPDWPVALAILAKGMVELDRETSPAAPSTGSGQAGTPGANGADTRPTATATTQGARKAPAAPRVGTGTASAPRTAGAAGQRGRGLQSLIQAAAKGDREGELAALESFL